jgi:hypothetical protein
MTWIFLGWVVARILAVDVAGMEGGSGQPPTALEGGSGQPPQVRTMEGGSGQPPKLR